MKELENKITAFAARKSMQAISVLESLLDYIIGFFDPMGQPIEDWKYDKEDNAEFYSMMLSYFQILEKELNHKEWFDAWGDLFMSLITKGGSKGQFFTPPSLCDLLSETSLKDEPKATQKTRFGKRVVVNDCACGSSRNMLAACASFEKRGWKKPYIVVEDLDLLCCKMSAVNLAVHGCFGEVICHDTLVEPDKVRHGYIINETMYPFPSGVPSIRPCKDQSKFFDLGVHKPQEKVKSDKSQPTQLTLF